jgi:tetratricopeptide (TPR) repeat protein
MRTSLVILFILACWTSARAGDDDTLRQERELFPDVLETITGKFVRHSPGFYEWQIRDRQARLAADPNNPALADDLAVAFLKTKQYAKAIDVLGKLAEADPGRAEIHARLGRAYILSGDPRKALPHLDQALAGRPGVGADQYFRWLAEYLAGQPKRGLPVAPVDPAADWPHRPRSFAVFLRAKVGKPDLDLDDARPVVAALVELLRTTNHESLPAHEALGDVLCYSSDPAKRVARRLAARAYLRAGYLQNSPGVRKPYITLAEWALVHRTAPAANYAEGRESMPVMTRLMEETDDAANWYAELSTREAEALAASPDPDRELERLYPDPPRVPDEPNDDWFTRNQGPLVRLGTIAVPGLILLALGSLGAYRFVRARRRPIPPVSGDGPAGPAAARPTALE